MILNFLYVIVSDVKKKYNKNCIFNIYVYNYIYIICVHKEHTRPHE